MPRVAPPFRLRKATAEDAEAVLSLIRGLAEFEREPDAVKVTRDELAAQLALPNPPFECTLAETADEVQAVIGFALFYQSYSTWLGRPGLYLEDLFVRSEHRGSGIGRALFQHGARLAVERGFGRYEWAALDWNQKAIDFYRSFGARPLDEWTTFRLSGEALHRAARE
jgi:ribosomal protein S18 acetylase RimI-like enzyme